MMADSEFYKRVGIEIISLAIKDYVLDCKKVRRLKRLGRSAEQIAEAEQRRDEMRQWIKNGYGSFLCNVLEDVDTDVLIETLDKKIEKEGDIWLKQ